MANDDDVKPLEWIDNTSGKRLVRVVFPKNTKPKEILNYIKKLSQNK
jgi:hypothetical protein